MSKFDKLYEETFGPGEYCFKTTVTDIAPGRFRVGKEDLYAMLEELKSIRAQDEADDWADNGFDDGEDDDGVDRCPECGIDLDFEQHEPSYKLGL